MFYFFKTTSLKVTFSLLADISVGIVDILLDNGALVDVKNRKKLTPYHYAHNVKVAGLLRKAQETSGIVKPKPLLVSR